VGQQPRVFGLGVEDIFLLRERWATGASDSPRIDGHFHNMRLAFTLDGNQRLQIDKLLRVLSLVTIGIISSACQTTSERYIVGVYRASTPCVTLTLVLNKNHSFVQTAKAKSGETQSLTGKWFVSHWEIDHRIQKTVDFDSFLDFHEGLKGSGGSGVQVLSRNCGPGKLQWDQ
jgi:hypothetical protein